MNIQEPTRECNCNITLDLSNHNIHWSKQHDENCPKRNCDHRCDTCKELQNVYCSECKNKVHGVWETCHSIKPPECICGQIAEDKYTGVSNCTWLGEKHFEECPLFGEPIDFIVTKPPVEDKCYSCGGKGYYTQMYGEVGSDDFGGEGYEITPTIHKKPCSACKGTGKKPKQELSSELSWEERLRMMQVPPSLRPNLKEFISQTITKVIEEEQNKCKKNHNHLGVHWEEELSPELSWGETIEGKVEAILGTVEVGIVELIKEEKQQAFNSGRASVIEEEQNKCKKLLNSGKGMYLLGIKEGRASMVENLERNIGMLRQWLNEDRIDDPKKMVSNEDLKHWIFLQALKNKETKE